MALGRLAQNITIYTFSIQGLCHCILFTVGQSGVARAGRMPFRVEVWYFANDGNIVRVLSVQAEAGLSSLLLYRGKERRTQGSVGRGRRARTFLAASLICRRLCRSRFAHERISLRVSAENHHECQTKKILHIVTRETFEGNI